MRYASDCEDAGGGGGRQVGSYADVAAVAMVDYGLWVVALMIALVSRLSTTHPSMSFDLCLGLMR